MNGVSLLLAFGLFLTIFSSGVLAHVEEDMPDAIAMTEYEMLVDMNPDDVESRYRLAMVYYRQKKYTQARAELDRVLETSPDHFHALEGLGLVTLELGEYGQSLAIFEKALLKVPDDNHIYYYLGRALEKNNDPSGAEKAYRTAIANHKKHVPPDDKQYAGDLAMFEKALAELNRNSDRK